MQTLYLLVCFIKIYLMELIHETYHTVYAKKTILADYLFI